MLGRLIAFLWSAAEYLRCEKNVQTNYYVRKYLREGTYTPWGVLKIVQDLIKNFSLSGLGM